MADLTHTIDRRRAREAFDSYVAAYDATNPRIALKVEHTLRVAELCERIAREAGFTPAGVDLAWLCGLLHDIGRFEQLQRWDTFSDAASTRHAALGVEVLFGNEGDTGVADDDGSAAGTIGIIHRFIDPSDELEEVIRAAVGFHSDYRLPEDLNVRTHAICDVVRDADKLDILRVASTDTVETVLNATEDELLASAVSPAIEDAFFEHHTAHYSERVTPVDYLVNLACFAFELVYPTSLEIADEQEYIYRALERPFGITRPFEKKATAQLMNRMDGHLRAWVDERLC
ncbi:MULTISPECIES: HD domain-containing protein [Enorma]|uniref:HD domain-containing protein n=1 Tax=Enorma TaxID=1472762 RepID=UPI00034633C1|nr:MULTISPECIES: HD domain-containing protein [Enorma]